VVRKLIDVVQCLPTDARLKAHCGFTDYNYAAEAESEVETGCHGSALTGFSVSACDVFVL